MRIECRCFNESGLEAASEMLDVLRDTPGDGIPDAMLLDPSLTAVAGAPLDLPKETFSSRWMLAVWLHRELGRSINDTSLLSHPGLWTWLAFALFPVIRPPGSRIYENARYVLNRDDFRKRYRHLVAGPYLVFATHEMQPHIVRGILATPPHAPGDLYEQFAARQELITSSAVMQVISDMYFDSSTLALRRGAAANARRLAEVLMQYDVTYDFGTITPQRLLDMLPREFRRFVPAQRGQE